MLYTKKLIIGLALSCLSLQSFAASNDYEIDSSIHSTVTSFARSLLKLKEKDSEKEKVTTYTLTFYLNGKPLQQDELCLYLEKTTHNEKSAYKNHRTSGLEYKYRYRSDISSWTSHLTREGMLPIGTMLVYDSEGDIRKEKIQN